MLRIDSAFGFLSDIIGKGVITGWELQEDNALLLKVPAGMGIIDRHVTRTLGPYTKTLLDNNVVYVWMRRRTGIVGQFSAFSDIASINNDDSAAPAIPSGLSQTSVTISSVSFSWTANSEIDFKEYTVYKSFDNITFTKLDTTTDNSYVDTDLEDDTVFYYRVTSKDLSDNESSQSSSLVLKTDKDTTPPADPSTVSITNADEALHLVWRTASAGDIDVYKAYITPVTEEGLEVGETFSRTVPGDQRDMTIPSLENGQRYRVVLVSVGTNEVESGGITLFGTPDVHDGPKDATDIIVTDEEGDNTISDVKLIIEWTTIIDPYTDEEDLAESYEIQLTEFDGEGGTFVSEFVEVPEGGRREFKVYPISDEYGTITYRAIRERTEYLIEVRAIDSSGRRSIGKFAVYTTRSFKTPRTPTQMTVSQRDDQSLLVTWVNSISVFEKNVFTFEKITDAGDSTVIEDETDIGRANSYIATRDLIESGADYIFTLKAVDEFGNESDDVEVTFSIPDVSDLERPPVPTQVIGVAGDRFTTLTWNRPNIEYFDSFRIYRSSEKVIYTAADFTRLATVDSDTFVFEDYGLNNGDSFVYFVTTVDIYGRESFNPVDDGFFDYEIVQLTPTRTGDLAHPTGLTVSLNGSAATSVTLSWDASADDFDGHEIYRSFDNKVDFVKIGTTDSAITTFDDNDVLLQDGVYYYMVRKFRNEADLFVTESDATVVGSVFIGKVTTEDGNMTFDISDVRDIKDLEDPVKEETKKRLDVHKHEFLYDLDDRRINLSDSCRS